MQDRGVPVSILIVDDNERQLLALESVLAGLELEIVAVTSGRAALRELLRRSFALVLLDVNLPGMDGFEIAALMRQRRECQSTPIIFMTAYGDDVYVERGYSLGAVDFMLTPIVPGVLRTKVSVFIELHRHAEQVRQQAQRLEQRATQLAALARQLTIAEERERRRVARLLHDDIQQLLAGATMLVRDLGGRHPQLGPDLEPLREVIEESLEASRSLAREISPPMLRQGGLVRALKDVAAKFGGQHGLECTLETPGEVPRLNDALEAFLYHAVGELLLNVVKHADAARVRILVQATREEMAIVVHDDGVGFQAPTAVPDGAGDHFGLASLRQRLELFDGALHAQRSPDGGASVRVGVPLTGANLLHESDAQRGPHRASARPDGAVGGRQVRVLIADDQEMIRRGLRSMLAGEPEIEIVGEARDGAEAVRMSVELEVDVVLMDLFMPRADGLSATRQITAASSGAHVLAMSTSNEEADISSVLEAGAVGFLSKTCSFEQLVSAIRTAAA